jgi:NAD(P)-dependent dehydrogenase (short-subunit alcohol dehydrogenase family)
MRAVLPHMIRNNHGKIMNFAGGGAAYGYPRFTAYAASKVAVVRMSETVAQECAGYNIQVNSIAPGAIDTEMLRAVRASGGEVRSVGTMDQPVALLLFLASPKSDHITGRFIHAKDSYREFLPDLPVDTYTLRRVQP